MGNTAQARIPQFYFIFGQNVQMTLTLNISYNGEGIMVLHPNAKYDLNTILARIFLFHGVHWSNPPHLTLTFELEMSFA